jgi:hypothetical protein
MSQNLSYALQEVNKKIENLSLAHDKLTAIVAAQSHMIKTLKSFHVEDFKKLAEEKNRRKQESNISSQKRVKSNNNQQRTQKGFDLEYEQMKQQMALLQTHLAQLTATPITTQTPQPVNNSSDNTSKVV